MSNKNIINENNSLIDDLEENQIHVKDITSSIITNPYGAITLPYDGSVDLNSFSRILEENLSSSYKIFWFFGIYEEIIKGNKYIPFRKLVCRMIVGAWYPVTHYKLSLGIQDRLYDLVILIHEKYNIPCEMNKNKLLELIENIEDVEVEKRIKKLRDYVPYRLLTPFFAKELALTKDIFKKNDYERNKFIARLTKEDERAIYKIDVDNRVIEINDSWYKYIRANQTIICGWMHYNLACYLQKSNKLPDLILYMDKFCEIQYRSFDIMQRNPKRYKKHLEGYLSINIAVNNERKIEKEDFNQKLKANIEPLYQIAFNQGYGVWDKSIYDEI